MNLRVLEVFARLGTLDINLATLNLGTRNNCRQLQIVLLLWKLSLLRLLKLHRSQICKFLELVGLETSDLSIQGKNSLQHLTSILLLLVAPLLKMVQRLANEIVKVREHIIGLVLCVCSLGSLLVDQRAKVGDTAVFFRGLVGTVALVANEVAVRAVRLQVFLQVAAGNFDFLARSASNLFLRAGLSVRSLLQHLEGRAAARVGAVDHSELALLENVVRVVLVRDLLHFAGVEGAGEGCALKEVLHHGVAVVHDLH